MHTSHPLRQSVRPLQTGLALLALAALCACGGGGGASAGNGGGQSAQKGTLSGRVIDGYLQDAQVCLDANANGVCEAGEARTTSGANGAYRLEVELAQLQASSQLLVSTDANTSDGGVKLGNARPHFTLRASLRQATKAGAAYTLNVTPYTTLVAASVALGQTPAAATQELTEAGANAQAAAGADFVGSADAPSVALATALANALGALQALPELKAAKPGVAQNAAVLLLTPKMAALKTAAEAGNTSPAAVEAVVVGGLAKADIDAAIAKAAGADVPPPSGGGEVKLAYLSEVDDGYISSHNSGQYDNYSPKLEITLPATATGYTLVMDDKDGPCANKPGGACVHWAVFCTLSESDPRTFTLAEKEGGEDAGFSGTCDEKNNYDDSPGYAGPNPPPEDQAHNYTIDVYAVKGDADFLHGTDPANYTRAGVKSWLGAARMMGEATWSGKYANRS